MYWAAGRPPALPVRLTVLCHRNSGGVEDVDWFSLTDRASPVLRDTFVRRYGYLYLVKGISATEHPITVSSSI